MEVRDRFTTGIVYPSQVSIVTFLLALKDPKRHVADLSSMRRSYSTMLSASSLPNLPIAESLCDSTAMIKKRC